MSDTTDSKSTIIPFPDFEALKKDVEKLYTELSMLFLERDTLMFIECRSIKMLYMLEVGGLEYKSYELECQIRRQKRKVELIQAKKNRQEIVILSQIDKALDTEFVEYNDKIDEKVKDMTASLNLRRVGKILSKEEVTELKTLYRSIAKSLHPDLHPEVSDAQIKLFNLAICAY
ncbi:MAG TPA: hypothetical protein PKV44_06330, partial [Bacillota bacterium]|nr:hypothetical protein [Bacillota bacterium]